MATVNNCNLPEGLHYWPEKHVWVKLERVPMDFMIHASCLQGNRKLAVADDAPRAHHIRNDVDTKWCVLDGHRNFRS